ncbi:hypothetical protein ACO1NJ_14445, partial [Staphylococcus aureus]
RKGLFSLPKNVASKTFHHENFKLPLALCASPLNTGTLQQGPLPCLHQVAKTIIIKIRASGNWKELS